MSENGRMRLRDLGVKIGIYPTGEHNAITDVPGILVGHKTLIHDRPSVARTGVTIIAPRNGKVHDDYPFAGFHGFNGVGEMTGLHLVEEWGVLTSPIVMTNTNQIGTAWEAISRYGADHYGGFCYKLPVIAETYDGFLNHIDSYPLTQKDVIEALESASTGAITEGNVGGGTGMICYGFKGGIGTSSRKVESGGKTYMVGAIVQANHGQRHQLRVNGVQVGSIFNQQVVPEPYNPDGNALDAPIGNVDSSSILVVIATDAPLLPGQCKRLAKRATIGMARTGGIGYNSSGDLFLAFSTGNHYLPATQTEQPISMIHQNAIDPFFEAAAEAVEESILNALTSAETMTGYRGRTVYALPLKELADLMESAKPSIM